jgi:hypothetical protein
VRIVLSIVRIWEIVSNRVCTSVTSVGIERTYSFIWGERVLRSSHIDFWSVMYFSRFSRKDCSVGGRSDHRVMGVIEDCCGNLEMR